MTNSEPEPDEAPDRPYYRPEDPSEREEEEKQPPCIECGEPIEPYQDKICWDCETSTALQHGQEDWT